MTAKNTATAADDCRYNKNEALEFIRQLIDSLPEQYNINTEFDERPLWRLVGQTTSDKAMKEYLTAIDNGILPMVNKAANVLLRVRLEYAYSFISSTADDFSYSRSELCRYLKQITTSNWEMSGFTWLVEKKANIRIWKKD